MKIGIFGCGGTIGRLLVREVVATEGCELSGGTSRPGGPHIGIDVGEPAGLEPVGLAISDDPRAVMAASDVIIDFSLAPATAQHMLLAAETGIPVVLGTTGFDADDYAAIDRAAADAAIVEAPNTSANLNFLLMLIERIAGVLGDEYDAEVLSMSERRLPFAPSGTAMEVAKTVAAGRGVNIDDVLEKVRDGVIGPRPPGTIGIAVVRGGRVSGGQRVIFAGDDEIVEVAYRSTDPAIYAKGAVTAAQWVVGKPPAKYSMRDVFGLA
ncbi:MAG: 4-hydroxy-tetrahydrodipicolinate reductase [Rhodospirillales bacterium]|jgi:4-hydroxy-tetrahydrodipicolinate reductase|nr:4-hydroxy-tetrahydrodipicolinate reductase [Rhodospirillales bacterium]